MGNLSNAAGAHGKPEDEPRFAADEQQPESSSNERAALAEREGRYDPRRQTSKGFSRWRPRPAPSR